MAKGRGAISGWRRSHPRSRSPAGAPQAGRERRGRRLPNRCPDRDPPPRERARKARRDSVRIDARRGAIPHNRGRATAGAIARRDTRPRRAATRRAARAARRSRRRRSCRDRANLAAAPDRRSMRLFQQWSRRVRLSISTCKPSPRSLYSTKNSSLSLGFPITASPFPSRNTLRIKAMSIQRSIICFLPNEQTASCRGLRISLTSGARLSTNGGALGRMRGSSISKPASPTARRSSQRASTIA